MPTWRENITLIRDGQSVDEQVTNRPIRELSDRTQYLKDRLDAQSAGEGLVLFSQPVSTKVAEGDVVYYDSTNAVFEQAIASAVDDATGTLRTADSAYVVGIVIRKISTTSADILSYGRSAEITLKDTLGNALANGNYYLSASDKGKLVSSRPSVAIFVCTVTSQGFIVNPTPREVLEDHIHHKFELLVSPAGTSICEGTGLVDIYCADSSIEGWLPATDPVFQGNAPTGAKFGYNIWQNPNLAALWPPQPAKGAYLELGGLGVSSDHYSVDANGIWWMTNCEKFVPWTATPCLSSSICTLTSSSSGAGIDTPLAACDTPVDRLILWFTRLVAKTDQSVVTGLKASTGSPIVINGCATPDSQGYCQSKLDLDLNMPWKRTTGIAGSEVVKAVSGQGGDLSTGHVVEGITGAGLISAAGTQILSGGQRAGLVTLTGLDPTSITRLLDVTLVALSGASESIYNDVLPFVGLPAGRQTHFIGKLRIPELSMVKPRLKIVLWFATPTAGTPPVNVTLEYVVIKAATLAGESSSSLVPGGDFANLPSTWTSVGDLSLEDVGNRTAGEYFAREPTTIVVATNELVMFRLTRSASDGYAGELAVVNMYGKLFDDA